MIGEVFIQIIVIKLITLFLCETFSESDYFIIGLPKKLTTCNRL